MENMNSAEITRNVRKQMFISACKEGNLEQIKHLRSLEVDFNCLGEYNTPAITLAIENGHKDVVNYLIESKCDVNICNGNGVTPLMKASELGMIDIMASLVEARADVFAQDSKGCLASMYACKGGSLDAVKFFGEKYEDVFKFQKLNGETHLLITLQNHKNKDCNKIASYIISKGKEDIFAQTYDYDMRVTYRNQKKSFTALDYAIVHDFCDVVEELVTFENMSKWGNCLYGHVKSVTCARILVNHGADFNNINDNGDTVLFCLNYIPIGVYQYFLTLNCDVNKINKNGDTALIYALKEEALWVNSKCVKALIEEKGADVLIRDSKGRTALDIMRESDKKEGFIFTHSPFYKYLKKVTKEQMKRNK